MYVTQSLWIDTHRASIPPAPPKAAFAVEIYSVQTTDHIKNRNVSFTGTKEAERFTKRGGLRTGTGNLPFSLDDPFFPDENWHDTYVALPDLIFVLLAPAR